TSVRLTHPQRLDERALRTPRFRNKPMKYRIFTLAVAASLAAPVYAESADDAGGGGAGESRTIIVIGQGATNAAEAQARATPGGADVVAHEDYADKSLISLRDTLAYSPGVYTQPRFGQEVRLSIR